MNKLTICLVLANMTINVAVARAKGDAATPVPPAMAAVDQPGAVMARINGQPLYMGALYETLLRDFGMQGAQQLVADELVRQAAAKEGISVSDADVQRQHNETLEQMFAQVDGMHREGLLEQLLMQRRITRSQWDATMRRNALLAKIAQREVQITDADLRREFGVAYGRKHVIRHIQVPTLPDAQKLLGELRNGKADFAEMARKHSTNASAEDGGLLPPIGADTPNVPPSIHQAAMAMEKVGDISEPVLASTAFHILYLESIIEPQNVEFEAVKGELEQNLRARQVRYLIQEVLHRLIVEAKDSGGLEWVNPVLKQQADQAAKAEQAAQPVPGVQP